MHAAIPPIKPKQIAENNEQEKPVHEGEILLKKKTAM